VTDDGTGFDVGGEDAPQGGLGSKLMSAFARQLRAQLEITSAPGEGTAISLYMPSKHKAPA